MVLLPNNILDPQWEWPLSSRLFEEYLQKKYPNINTQGLLHHYEKTIAQTELTTNKKTIFSVQLDQTSWDSTVEGKTIVQTATGLVEVVVTKKSVSAYDYESFLNEKRRSIKLINSAYTEQIETEMLELMA
jgi:hypothetical protein